MAERFGLDPEAVLGNIVVARAHTSEHQAGGCTRGVCVCVNTHVAVGPEAVLGNIVVARAHTSEHQAGGCTRGVCVCVNTHVAVGPEAVLGNIVVARAHTSEHQAGGCTRGGGALIHMPWSYGLAGTRMALGSLWHAALIMIRG